MEDRLQSLMTAGNKENRTKWVRQWQKQGKKVIGVLDSLVPEEVIYAAGMLPWRIPGTLQATVSLAMMYRLPQSNAFINHVLESVLSGELDFLDGLVCSTYDEDFVRCWDIWKSLEKTPFTYLVHVPIIDSKLAQRMLAVEIADFIGAIERFGELNSDSSSLRHAILVYDRGRTLLRKIYELRKREVPPLSGAEFLGITTAAMVMPRDEFNRELEELLPYLEQREANVKYTRPRLLISADFLDNPAYVDMVEEVGCLVAMDDLDTGSRYCWETVDGDDQDPTYALARRYLKNRSARMLAWAEQAEQLEQWVREFRIDGVLDLSVMYDYSRDFRMPFIEGRLKQTSIPVMSIRRDYPLAFEGQLKTRIGAFLEMIEGGPKG